MAKRIVIDPVTRIEGHAKISIFMDDAGNVADAEFHVVEFRGFEKFCEGRPYPEMPGITQRICGICPVSHTLASAKAGGEVRPGPADLWADIWLQLITLLLERVANKEWQPDQGAVRQVIESAWVVMKS